MQASLCRDALEPILYLILCRDFLNILKLSGQPGKLILNTFGAGGLFLTLSELHKFGLFYLNKGKWNGKQLLNAAWIEESTKPSDTEQYGYLFWRGKYNSYRADGKYSQLSIVLPDADAVVSLVAECRNGEELTQAINDLICAQL